MENKEGGFWGLGDDHEGLLCLGFLRVGEKIDFERGGLFLFFFLFFFSAWKERGGNFPHSVVGKDFFPFPSGLLLFGGGGFGGWG